MKAFIILFFLGPFVGLAQTPTDSCEIYIPNVITPDCEEVDCDCFEVISDCLLEDFTLKIFNRWGEILFESTDSLKKWCPNQQTEMTVEEGVYVWKIEYRFKADENGDGLFEVDEMRSNVGHVTYLR